ncbi:hypothetical protein L6452_40496 [Arctium lappa]|uniref:Uncharacterized protein n=1 Tax=Arctium lappa TaxID=4217 RepID=A0ACB8XMF1_ARCLA|nr:hypothetical protein L6452_40496 [Arctium lappa]
MMQNIFNGKLLLQAGSQHILHVFVSFTYRLLADWCTHHFIRGNVIHIVISSYVIPYAVQGIKITNNLQSFSRTCNRTIGSQSNR